MTDWALPTLKLLCCKSYTPLLRLLRTYYKSVIDNIASNETENLSKCFSRQHHNSSRKQQVLVRMQRNWSPWRLLTVMENGTAIQESNLVIPPKVNIELTYDQAVSLPGTSKRGTHFYIKRAYAYSQQNHPSVPKQKSPNEYRKCEMSPRWDCVQPQARMYSYTRVHKCILRLF